MGTLTADERLAVIRSNPLHRLYERTEDPRSAHEVLTERAQRRQQDLQAEAKVQAEARTERKSAPRASNRQSSTEAFVKSMVRSVGTSVGRSLGRNCCGVSWVRCRASERRAPLRK